MSDVPPEILEFLQKVADQSLAPELLAADAQGILDTLQHGPEERPD